MSKPTDQVPPFAVGNFGAGGDPWSGTARRNATNLASWAAAGYTPETPIVNENLNEYLARLQEHAAWVFDGSNADDEDAHVIETDANGQINAARAQIGAHSAAGPSLSVTGSASLSSILASHTGAQPAILAQNSGTAMAIFGQGTGAANIGVQGEATGASAGVRGLSGNSAAGMGVLGDSAHADAAGMKGQSNASSSLTGRGVWGLGRAAGTGVYAQVEGGGTGYALLVAGDLSAPVTAAVRIAPQSAEPSGADAEGDLYPNSANNMLWYRDDGAFKAVHNSLYGYSEGFDEGAGASIANGTEQVTGMAQAQVQNRVTADIVVAGEVTIGGTVAEHIEIKIRAGTGIGGAIIAQRDVRLPSTTAAGDGIPVSLSGKDTSVAAGNNDYTLTIHRVTGIGTIYWSTNTLTARTSSVG